MPDTTKTRGAGGEVISVHEGKRVNTKRKKKQKGRANGYGDLDPPNHRLDLLLKGVLKPEDLDDEELSAGIPKCDDGKFSARSAIQASSLPAAMQKAIQQELFKRADQLLSGSLLQSIGSIIQIATNDNVLDDGKPAIEPKDRLKASIYILERMRGKTPDVIVHSQDKPWEIVLDEVETTTRAEARARRKEIDNAIDAEIVDEPKYMSMVDPDGYDPDIDNADADPDEAIDEEATTEDFDLE